MNLKNTENFWVLGLFLGITGLVSALLLALFSDLVAAPIAKAELENKNQALRQILPPFDNQPTEQTVERNGILFMGAYEKGKLVAVAAEASARGYAGPVRGLVGLDPDGKIRAMLITAQNETPGLGANVCQRQFRKTIFNLFDKRPEGLAPNPILDQFNGKVAEKGKNWRVKKDGGTIDYVTGATITSRTVTALADQVAQCYLTDGAAIRAELEKAGGKEK